MRIVGIYIPQRVKDAAKVQSILTEYGCSIKTRLGLHEVTADNCSNQGLVLLEMTGEVKEMDAMEEKLRKLEGIQIQRMDFSNA